MGFIYILHNLHPYYYNIGTCLALFVNKNRFNSKALILKLREGFVVKAASIFTNLKGVF